MKRIIALILTGCLFMGLSALAETGASIGPDGRLIVQGSEGEAIGENVQAIVAQTDDAVYFTQGAETGGAEATASLWVYQDGAAQRVSDLASNAVYDAAGGAIYFLLVTDSPKLMALDTATGEISAVSDLNPTTALNAPEIELNDGALTVYTASDSGEKTVAATLPLPAALTMDDTADASAENGDNGVAAEDATAENGDSGVAAEDATAETGDSGVAAEDAAAETGDSGITAKGADVTAKNPEDLARGDTGEEVKSLQQRLLALNYPVGTADGVFGYKTHQSVRYFQDAQGIAQTGIVTPDLKEEIFADSAPEYVQYVALARGSHGIRVEVLQSRLRALGYTTASVDGDYGSGTAEAVRKFQSRAGLKQTGSASVATLKALMAKSAPAYNGYITLSEGDTGSRVKKLQERLYKLGYYAGARDGNFDSRTADAVELFQKAIGVKQSGTATMKLQERLFSSKAKKCSEYIELRYGDTGTRVKELQTRLKALGFYDGEIGGHFRTQTRTAVKAFQKALGIKKTGVASVSLQKKLYADDAPTATP